MSLTEQLQRFFQVEQQIHALNSRVENAEIYLRAQSKKLEDLIRQEENLEGQQRKLAAVIGNFETEIKSVEERMEHLRAQMNEARTNKEYTATLTELKTLETDKDRIESETLTEMSKLEEIRGQIDELKALVTERRKIREVAEQQLEERRQAVAERLSELQGERAAAGDDIPEHAMRTYKDAAHLHEGEAMAEIVELDKRRHEYTCGACNMTLPMECYSSVLSNGKIISTCPSCTRILYLGSELRETAKK